MKAKVARPLHKNEKTGTKVASKASKLLRNPNTPAAAKSVAGSVLTQTARRSPIGKSVSPQSPPTDPPKRPPRAK